MSINFAEYYREYTQAHDAIPFERLSIDSFELVALRVEVERVLGGRLDDATWLSFRSFADIRRHCTLVRSTDAARTDAGDGIDLRRSTRVGMPQMAVGGLAEGWLFRELGDMHWEMISSALGASSSAIVDGLGRRLYATFVRIRLECSAHLKSIRENDQLVLDSSISRFGAGVWVSDAHVTWPKGQMRARLMSTFATRGESNTQLLRGEPVIPAGCTVRVLDEMPAFMTEYRAVRSERQNAPMRNPVAEATYDLNPYTDFNGVNLLYFASFPVIHDTIERMVTHTMRDQLGFDGDWALASATRSRDISYFANCAIHDAITVTITRCERVGDLVEVESALRRVSDGAVMASISIAKEVP